MSSTAADNVLADFSSAIPARRALEQRFDRLLAENGPALSRMAGSYTHSTSDRDDLFQEIAMAVWQALPHFRGDCSERTFLFRIAQNRALSYLARNRYRGMRKKEESEDELEMPDPRPDPEASLAREQQGERLFSAIRLLPVIYRQVVTLTLEGIEYREIAQILGISESNVGVRLNRGRRVLRGLLEDQR
jgi:RNA polymerase sigma-70 factor (ECF subfamily)